MPPERSFELPDPHFVARYVPCTTGCQDPKVPKEPNRAWFSMKAKECVHASVQEELLYAIFMRFDAAGSVEQLKSWARAVVEEQFVATELKEAWAPSDTWGVHNSVSKLFEFGRLL